MKNKMLPEVKDCVKYINKGSHPIAVSYTHLRAHETDSYLVCRLLLEKKKKKKMGKDSKKKKKKEVRE